MQTLNQTLKANVTVMRCPERHACTPVNQIIIQIYMICYILSNITIQPHFSQNNQVKQINFLLIVEINSIPFM